MPSYTSQPFRYLKSKVLRGGGAAVTSDTGGGGQWSPSSLGPSLRAWWSADRFDLITLLGSQVTSWKDVVQSYDMVQAISASRPVYSQTSFNGAPGLSFDGTDDELTLASQPFTVPCEVWVICEQAEPAANASTKRVFSFGGTGNNNSIGLVRDVLASTNIGRVQVGTGAGSVQSPISTAADFTGRCLQRAIVTTSNVQHGLNGMLGVAQAVVPSIGATRVRVGASVAGLGYWFGQVRDILITDILSPEQAVSFETWAMPRRML